MNYQIITNPEQTQLILTEPEQNELALMFEALAEEFGTIKAMHVQKTYTDNSRTFIISFETENDTMLSVTNAIKYIHLNS